MTMIRSAAARCEPVGDDQRGARLHQPLERLLHQPLALGVERGLVASSSSRIGASRSSARAMAMRWRWPPERRAPPSPRKVSSPCGSSREEGLGVGGAGRFPDRFLAGVPVAVAQVVARAGGEQHACPAAPAPCGGGCRRDRPWRSGTPSSFTRPPADRRNARRAGTGSICRRPKGRRSRRSRPARPSGESRRAPASRAATDSGR